MNVDKLSIEPLDVGNYATWSVRMRFLLITKGLWAPIIASSEEERTASAAHDDKALALIGLCVKDHHLATLAECRTARDAWNKLESIHKAKSNARRLQLRRELNMLRKDNNEPLTKYFARAKTIQDELIAAGYPVQDQEVVTCTLAGLPTEYDTMTTVLEASDTELDLDATLAKLLIVEQRLSKKHGVDEASAYISKPVFKSYNADRTCFNCGKKGHIAVECSSRSSSFQQQPYRSSTRYSSPSSTLHKTFQAIALSAAASPPPEQVWVLDSGATNHITNDVTKMFNVRAVGTSITFGNGSKAKATHIGEARVYTSHGRHITLQDVLYAPEAKTNLFSIPQATKNGAVIEFRRDTTKIKYDGYTIAMGYRQQNGLYTLSFCAWTEQAKETKIPWEQRQHDTKHKSQDEASTIEMDIDDIPEHEPPSASSKQLSPFIPETSKFNEQETVAETGPSSPPRTSRYPTRNRQPPREFWKSSGPIVSTANELKSYRTMDLYTKSKSQVNGTRSSPSCLKPPD
jgi:hypothetical protein